MVIKNLENKIRLTGIVCTAFLCRMRHHQRVEHLDGPDDGRGRAQEVYVLDGKRADISQPDHDGRNARCRGQEPCRNVPPLLFHPCAG